MTTIDHCISTQLAWNGGEGSTSAAVDGFAVISESLRCHSELAEIQNNSATDLFAIAIGWAVLAMVIYYPALQIAAMVATAAIFGISSFVRTCIKALRADSSATLPMPAFA